MRQGGSEREGEGEGRRGRGNASTGAARNRRRRLTCCLFTMDPMQIALQVALVYAKIARSDYPRDWPSLFHDLLANLNTAGQSSSSSTLTIRRVYLILHHIIKELSSKRLFADQKNFSEVGWRGGGTRGGVGGPRKVGEQGRGEGQGGGPAESCWGA